MMVVLASSLLLKIYRPIASVGNKPWVGFVKAFPSNALRDVKPNRRWPVPPTGALHAPPKVGGATALTFLNAFPSDHHPVWSYLSMRHCIHRRAISNSNGPRRLFSSSTDGDASTSSASSTSAPSSTTSFVTLVPETRYESELSVKRSRFVAYAQHVSDWSEAKTFIEWCQKDHPKARHWCHAYRGVVVSSSSASSSSSSEGDQPDTMVITERCNDDGEPSGTAGQPILNALQQAGLVDVVCVVVRYFGGIKLGAGGLIRAYGGAARQVLRESPVERIISKTTFIVRGIGPNGVGVVYDSVAKVGGSTSNEMYDEFDGRLTVTITCDSSVKGSLQATLMDATKGNIEFGPP